MSRLAEKPIQIPEGVTVKKAEQELHLAGPKGQFRLALPPTVEVRIGEGAVMVGETSSDKQAKMDVGTTWSKIRNAVLGVTRGFEKVLEIEGVGYRAVVEGDALVLSLGYVNPIRFQIPPGTKVTTEKSVIRISGIDKELVGQVAAEIRALKKPEPYKGKGIRYQGEVIKRKAGKKAVATTT